MNNRIVCYKRINIKNKRGIFKKQNIHWKKIANRKASINVETLKKRKNKNLANK